MGVSKIANCWMSYTVLFVDTVNSWYLILFVKSVKSWYEKMSDILGSLVS